MRIKKEKTCHYELFYKLLQKEIASLISKKSQNLIYAL